MLNTQMAVSSEPWVMTVPTAHPPPASCPAGIPSTPAAPALVTTSVLSLSRNSTPPHGPTDAEAKVRS